MECAQFALLSAFHHNLYMTRIKYTKEVLEPAVAQSYSVMQVLDFLGLKRAGSNHTNISNRIKEYGLDTSHFKGSAWNKGVKQNKFDHTANLVMLEVGVTRPKRDTLHAGLQQLGREYKCEKCSLGAVWQGEKMVLHIDHVDGNWLNNLPDNLRYLCPNCHSQTDTFSRKKTMTLCSCGNQMDSRSKMCYACVKSRQMCS